MAARRGRTSRRKTCLPAGACRTSTRRPLAPGTAYIAVYRFLFEHDLKPYIYRTDDYGATWTKLTDGTNGIPDDHPTRVVREDPEQPGLLYAGTEFGFFVSFDNGGEWHSLQQNLPATPVTDLRVHRGDIVISTMGRAFWIMDDVSPLRQLATAAVDLSRPALLQPSSRIRYRAAAGGRRGGGGPEYPADGAADRLPAAGRFQRRRCRWRSPMPGGRVVRTVRPRAGSAAAAGAGRRAPADPDDPDMRGGRGRGGAPAALTTKPGHNRFMWDYRWANGGPLAAPGRYTVKLQSARSGGESAPVRRRSCHALRSESRSGRDQGRHDRRGSRRSAELPARRCARR